MTQTPKQWYDRVHAVIGDSGYREPDFSSWMSWPWVGDLTTKPLDPPVAAEPARAGGGGAGDCQICTWSQDPDIDYLIWRDETWMIGLPFEPSSLPFAAFLMPRRHADLQDLTPAESARQGELLTAVEQAACATFADPADPSGSLGRWIRASALVAVCQADRSVATARDVPVPLGRSVAWGRRCCRPGGR